MIKKPRERGSGREEAQRRGDGEIGVCFDNRRDLTLALKHLPIIGMNVY